mmetsp:Transcript_11478/g.31754  ORF Transcript_11478/g.31754 Transcript_11478/m.31754 type:complete len:226 (-) Transcript_11478:1639-2316(-)
MMTFDGCVAKSFDHLHLPRPSCYQRRSYLLLPLFLACYYVQQIAFSEHVCRSLDLPRAFQHHHWHPLVHDAAKNDDHFVCGCGILHHLDILLRHRHGCCTRNVRIVDCVDADDPCDNTPPHLRQNSLGDDDCPPDCWNVFDSSRSDVRVMQRNAWKKIDLDCGYENNFSPGVFPVNCTPLYRDPYRIGHYRYVHGSPHPIESHGEGEAAFHEMAAAVATVDCCCC